MNPIFQNRLHQAIQKQTTTESQPEALAVENSEPQAATFTQNERALLLIDGRRNVLAINPTAAHMLGVVGSDIRGQSVDAAADGVLAAISLRPNAMMATTMFEIASGRTVTATTRPVFNRNRQFSGWVVVLQENVSVPTQPCMQDETTIPVALRLQSQIKNMQEFITMLPQFSQHQYWRHLLIEHMEQLTQQMSSQVQRLSPPLA